MEGKVGAELVATVVVLTIPIRYYRRHVGSSYRCPRFHPIALLCAGVVGTGVQYSGEVDRSTLLPTVN